ncbi:MAG: hypothetical protein AB2693_24910 [Candidatus Thiodiazotropha sp.]
MFGYEEDRLPDANADVGDTVSTERLSICDGSGVGDTIISIAVEAPLVIEPLRELLLENVRLLSLYVNLSGGAPRTISGDSKKFEPIELTELRPLANELTDAPRPLMKDVSLSPPVELKSPLDGRLVNPSESTTMVSTNRFFFSFFFLMQIMQHIINIKATSPPAAPRIHHIKPISSSSSVGGQKSRKSDNLHSSTSKAT